MGTGYMEYRILGQSVLGNGCLIIFTNIYTCENIWNFFQQKNICALEDIYRQSQNVYRLYQFCHDCLYVPERF